MDAPEGQENDRKAEHRKAVADAIAERKRKAAEAKREIEARTVTVITTALALVAALFWQTAITDTIKTFIPVNGAWQYEVAVALMITVLAAWTIYMLNSWVSGKAKD